MEIFNWYPGKPYNLESAQRKAQQIYDAWILKHQPGVMKAGDIVHFEYYGGSANGRVVNSLWHENIFHFCAHPMYPYIWIDGELGSTSGGPFFGVNADIIAQCQYIGESSAVFWTFVDLPQANGGAEFALPVNVWNCPVKF